MTPNAPLNAAIEAAKAARLPAHIEAQIARIGVKPERPEPVAAPRRMWERPTAEEPECPF